MTSRADSPLTAEDLLLLRMLADGLGPEAIGRRLGVSDRTVRRRQHSLCLRLGVGHVMQALVIAAKRGLV